MNTTVSVELVKAWADEAEDICIEAERLVLAEGNSRRSRSILRIAMLIRKATIDILEAARGVS